MAGRPASSAGNSGFNTLSCSPKRSSVGARAKSAAESSRCRARTARPMMRGQNPARRAPPRSGPLVVGGPVSRAVDEAQSQDLTTSFTSSSAERKRRRREFGVYTLENVLRFPHELAAARFLGIQFSSCHSMAGTSVAALYLNTTGACPGG